uniref:Uncharacterized protein n=1 Tax=Arundo donax TaxID=35708 RepID=A0A0A9EXQ9_ARUDO
MQSLHPWNIPNKISLQQCHASRDNCWATVTFCKRMVHKDIISHIDRRRVGYIIPEGSGRLGGGGGWAVAVRRGWREAVGDGPAERLGRLAGGGGGYGGRGGDRSRRAVRWQARGPGGVVARAGDPLGRLPERHLAAGSRGSRLRRRETNPS